MTDKKLQKDIKIFFMFLYRNNLYNKYFYNFGEDCKRYNNISSDIKIRKINHILRNFERRVFFSAFSWGSSKEGFYFWSTTNQKWDKFYEAKNKL